MDESRSTGRRGVLERLRDPRPITLAHRGCSQRGAGENSMGSIRDCIELGIEFAEIDPQESADGEIVLLHDFTLDRMTDRTGRVADLPLAELRTIRIRRGNGGLDEPLTDDTIPTFAEALHVAKGSLVLWIDPTKGAPLDKIISIVEAEQAEDWVMFMFDAASVPDAPEWVRRRTVGGAIQDGVNGGSSGFSRLSEALDHLATLEQKPPFAVALFTDDAYVDRVVRRDEPRILGYGGIAPISRANEERRDFDRDWSELLALGITFICTDDPLGLQTHIDSTYDARAV